MDKQLSVEKLPPGLHAHITLVCPANEVEALVENYPGVSVLAMPKNIKTLSQKRAWIALNPAQDHEFAFQIDDDLKFYVWNGEKHVAALNDLEASKTFFLKKLPELLDTYKCVGFGTKGFALPGGIKEDFHLGFAFGFTKNVAKKIVWDRIRFYEDIDYTLQLLTSGVKIALTYDLVVEQRKADAEGGLSEERTPALMEESLKKLLEFYPGIVKVKPPSSKHPYSNTLISWKRAAALGALKHKPSASLF